MRTSRFAAAILALATVAPVGAQSVPAAVPPSVSSLPVLGTWRLNVSASDWNPPPMPYGRATWKVEPAGDQVKMTYDMIGTRGGVTHMEWTGRFDGQDYQVQGPDSYVTYAYRVADDRTLDLIVKVEGRVVTAGQVTVSPDGRRATTRTVSPGPRGEIVSSTVYDRR
ncbi:MAG: hypothetical protein ABL961_18115 [Vicinamibacterales bacterium]